VTKATAATVATVAPTVAATRTPTPTAGVTRRIVNTDGRGVALRASPGGDRLPGKGYDEGATVQAFESNGQWTRIQGSDGRQGWVLTVTLAP
jgi:SH3-like domain-containing protein